MERREYLERRIPYFPLRFLIHLVLLSVSVLIIVPVAVWLGDENPWLTMAIYVGLMAGTALPRLFLISLIVVLVAQSIEAQG